MVIGNELKGLKICFMAGTLGMGGAEKQLYYILRALKGLGAEVHLICNYGGEYWEEPIRNLGINYYSLSQHNGFRQRIIAAIKLARKIKPDVVQAQHFYTSMHAAIVARFCGAISVGAARASVKCEMEETNRFGKWCFKLPKYFVVNSLEAYNEGIELGRNKDNIFYLPNALEADKFLAIDVYKNKTNESVTLVSIGRLVAQKRFDRYIRLVAELKKTYPNLKAILVGGGVDEAELMKQAAEAGLSNEDFFFTGASSTPEKYLAQADIYVLTSDNEGTPNVVLEAMASGLPVVSTNIGNVPFFLENGVHGFLVDRTDENALLEKVKMLADNLETRQKMGENARKMIMDRFSVDALSRNIISLYTKIIPRKN